MSTYDINWSGVLHSSSGTVSIGKVMCLHSSGTYYVVATTANLALANGIWTGVALSAGTGNDTISIQQTGYLTPANSGIAAGTAGYAEINSTGTLVRATDTSATTVGQCDAFGGVVLSQPGAGNSLIQHMATHVHVDAYGAKGDADGSGGGTDDTASIQQAINSGDHIYLGSKVYRINSKLTIKNTAAGGYAREKFLIGNSQGTYPSAQNTRIIYDGVSDPTTPMLQIYSSSCVVDGICFLVGTNKAVSSAVSVTQGDSAYIMTENQFRHCEFGTAGRSGASMSYGVYISGNDSGSYPTVNGDYCRFDKCAFLYCGVGIGDFNPYYQSVEHVVNDCRFGGADFVTGGPAHVQSYAVDVFSSNFHFTNCAFANQSGAVFRQKAGNALGATRFDGGSCELSRAFISTNAGSYAGIPSPLEVNNFRFHTTASYSPAGTYIFDVITGGDLHLRNLTFSGSGHDQWYFSVQNPSTDDPPNLTCINCSLPNLFPFKGSLGSHMTYSLIDCNTFDRVTTITEPLHNQHGYINGTLGTKKQNRFWAVHDNYGNQVVGPRLGPVADLAGGATLADTITKVNSLITVMETHGLIQTSFTPTSYAANCVYAFTGDSGFSAASWTNQGSGANVAQGTAGNQPSASLADSAFNYQDVADFSGATDYMETAAEATLDTTVTVYIVASAGAAPGIYVSSQSHTTNYMTVYANGTSVVMATSGAGITAACTCANVNLIIAVFNAGTCELYVNTLDTPTATGACGADTFKGLTIGANHSASQTLQGKVGAVLVYNDAHTRVGQDSAGRYARQAIGSALAQKYGITLT